MSQLKLTIEYAVMLPNDLLIQAIQLAQQAHDGQVDKAGLAYIQHPLRVMHQMKTIEAKIIAILHDTLEDTWVTHQHLKALGLGIKHIDALNSLTKLAHENRFDVLKRTLVNPLACEVKCADVHDNMNLTRLKSITKKDLQRYQQYCQIYAVLQQACEFYQRINAQHINTTIGRNRQRLTALAVQLYTKLM